MFGKLSAIILLALLISACEDAPNEARRELPGAVQTIYQQAVPHTDRMGRLRFSYRNCTSFFPVALYHSLTGRHKGHTFQLKTVAEAGFNSIHPWEGQRLDAIIADARANNLQIIFHYPTDAEVKKYALDPNVLAWYLAKEPTGLFTEEAIYGKLAAYNKRVAEIRAIDKARPIFPLDRPILKGREADWKVWASIGDISSHFYYPISGDKTASLEVPNDMPESVLHAARLNAYKRPVWMVVQAFTKPSERWTMPSTGQLRAMTYAAIIHGATGIIFFSYDSFVTRNGLVIGIAPNPIERHQPLTKTEPLAATKEQLSQSRALWGATKRLNRELAALAPLILTPISKRKLRVFVAGKSVSKTPIRALLKEKDGEVYVIAVNLDETPLEAEFQLGVPPKSISIDFAENAKPTATPKGWRDKLDGFATRVYRVTP